MVTDKVLFIILTIFLCTFNCNDINNTIENEEYNHNQDVVVIGFTYTIYLLFDFLILITAFSFYGTKLFLIGNIIHLIMFIVNDVHEENINRIVLALNGVSSGWILISIIVMLFEVLSDMVVYCVNKIRNVS